MKIDEIRQLSDEELQAELLRQRRHLFDLRSQSVTEKLQDTSILKKEKHDVARMLTEIRARDLKAKVETAST